MRIIKSKVRKLKSSTPAQESLQRIKSTFKLDSKTKWSIPLKAITSPYLGKTCGLKFSLYHDPYYKFFSPSLYRNTGIIWRIQGEIEENNNGSIVSLTAEYSEIGKLFILLTLLLPGFILLTDTFSWLRLFYSLFAIVIIIILIPLFINHINTVHTRILSKTLNLPAVGQFS